jgi:hypothetical protein
MLIHIEDIPDINNPKRPFKVNQIEQSIIVIFDMLCIELRFRSFLAKMNRGKNKDVPIKKTIKKEMLLLMLPRVEADTIAATNGGHILIPVNSPIISGA